jgi:mannitol/fructose-specific phosphotransferase system IIA component (Ntr-type)
MRADQTSLTETAHTLADFTSSKLILPSMDGEEASAVIRELSILLQSEGRVPDSAAFCQSVLQREILCGTVTEPGWAIPHGVVKDLGEPCFALGRWLSPKTWTSSHQKVNLVFLFVIPESNVQVYNHLVISLGGLSKDTRLVEQLLKAGNGDEMFNVLKRVKLAVPHAG